MHISIHNIVQCCIHKHITYRTYEPEQGKKAKIEIPLHHQKPVTMQSGVKYWGFKQSCNFS